LFVFTLAIFKQTFDLILMKTQHNDISSRENILLVALRLFANQGLERTTVRQIAKEAQVNVSAISYYFGDKNGLYRAAFTETMPSPMDVDALKKSAPTLEQFLYVLFNAFIAPLKQGELAKLCMRLHMREMVEPTGLWSDTITNEIEPSLRYLQQELQQSLGLKTIDDDLQRLTINIVGMGVHLLCGRDVIEQFCPQIMDTEQALNETHAALVRFAMSMVETEAARRKTIPT
jgi:TetR/AcrR family transcriptional regulator, regulator of cefoperazone and chloramphenicol sensitivity